MPLLLILGAVASLPLLGVAVDNFTQKPPTIPSAGGVNNNFSTVIKWVVIGAGTILAVKYGSRLIRKI